jgi:hypothetical protein
MICPRAYASNGALATRKIGEEFVEGKGDLRVAGGLRVSVQMTNNPYLGRWFSS